MRRSLQTTGAGELYAFVLRAASEIVEQYEESAQTMGRVRLDDHRGEWQFDHRSESVRLTLVLDGLEVLQPTLDDLNISHGRCLWFTSLDPSTVSIRIKAVCLPLLAAENL